MCNCCLGNLLLFWKLLIDLREVFNLNSGEHAFILGEGFLLVFSEAPENDSVCLRHVSLNHMQTYDILKPFSDKCVSHASSYYSMALRPFRVPYLPKLLLPNFPVPCCRLPVRIWSKSTASVQTESFHLPLVFPRAFFPWVTLSLLLWEYKNDPSLLHG
jgi:hypothetical protein